MRPDGWVEEYGVWAFVISGKIGLAQKLARQHPLRHRTVGGDGDVMRPAIGNDGAFGKAPEKIITELVGVDLAYGGDLFHLLDGKIADPNRPKLALPPCR